MALFTLDNARDFRKSVLDNAEEQANTIAEDLARQSKTLDEALAGIRHWIHTYPEHDTFVISVLSHPIIDAAATRRIGEQKISAKVQKLLEDKYRDAFPDFKIERDEDRYFVFYLRVDLSEE